MTFEEERVGNPYPYLDILVVKKFTAQFQVTQRDWKDVKLVFTVDSNLLIHDEKEGKIVVRLMDSNLKMKKIS